MKHQIRNSAILFLILLVPTMLILPFNELDVVQIIYLIVGVAFFSLYLVRRFIFLKTKKQDNLTLLVSGYVKGVEIFTEVLVLLMFIISVWSTITEFENANLVLMSGAYLCAKEFFFNIPYIGDKYLYLATQFPNNYIKLEDIISTKKLEHTLGNLNPKVFIKYDLGLKNGKVAELSFDKLSFTKEKEELLDKHLLKEL